MNTPRNFFVNPFEEQETVEIAIAILRKCYHVLTGGEIYMLERIVEQLTEDCPGLLISIDEINWFYSLQTQFSREIAQYRNQLR
jgi:hypothetical protein